MSAVSGVGHLDIQIWTVGNRSEAIARALEKYEASPTPIPDALRERFRANGFRVLAIPNAEVDALRLALPTAGPSEQRRLVETTDWAVAVEGPSWRIPVGAALDTGYMELGPGRLRLLVRSWATPQFGRAGGPHSGQWVDLLVEHAGVPRRGSFDPTPTLRQPERFAFERLSFEIVLEQATAIVLVPEEPSVSWAERAEAYAGRNAPVVESGSSEVGPPAPQALTLGELMLGGRRSEGSGGARRIVVLRPGLGARFRLLTD
ncbi:MAG: hypothetical protein KF866_09545 [Phycisphaeraceae bacterium]|nr:hypothetical protein [Phycisphaeraceae bacterium]MCW5754741.1 hypothetical protein [Phycisphaeraceae bacterium]